MTYWGSLQSCASRELLDVKYVPIEGYEKFYSSVFSNWINEDTGTRKSNLLILIVRGKFTPNFLNPQEWGFLNFDCPLWVLVYFCII